MATKKTTEVIDVTNEVVKNPNDEWIEIPALFYDKERYSEPVFVGINGKTYLIPRGVSGLKVPRAVKEVLDNSAYQNQMANRFMANIEGNQKLGEF